jgi:hypothetical protein
MGYGWLNIGFINHAELHFADHWHMQTTVLNVLQFPIDVSGWQLLSREILQLPALAPLVTAACAELLSADNSTIGSQAGGYFTPTSWFSFTGWLLTDNWTLSLTNQLLHVTSLNWTGADEPHRKHNAFSKQLPGDSPSIADMFTGRYQETCIPSHCHCIATAIHATVLQYCNLFCCSGKVLCIWYIVHWLLPHPGYVIRLYASIFCMPEFQIVFITAPQNFIAFNHICFCM